MTTQANFTVGTSPVLLSPTATHSGVDITIQNNSVSDIFIGPASVTTTTFGFKLPPNSAISFALKGFDEIYGVSATNSSVNVLTLGL
jgi:hypothetical protein